MRGPEVYNAITAVTGELTLAGIPKNRTNLDGGYQYRSIEDVLAALSPLLAKHKLCVLPRALERSVVDRSGLQNTLLVNVQLKVAYDLVSSDDASIHTVIAYGEALDDGDKATAKATSAAYKSAMLQTFCIPVSGTEEPEQASHKLGAQHEPAPPQGWDPWVKDVSAIVEACLTNEALERVQNSNRGLLVALSRERADLYANLGGTFEEQRLKLRLGSDLPDISRPAVTTRRRSKRGSNGSAS